MLTRNFVKETAVSERIQGFVVGFQVGIIMALAIALISLFVRNIMAMRSAERLKELYISETDERNLFILQKSGSIGMNIAIYGLAVGSSVAGNINDTVFFTLLGACLFVALIRGFFKLYYRIKY